MSVLANDVRLRCGRGVRPMFWAAIAVALALFVHSPAQAQTGPPLETEQAAISPYLESQLAASAEPVSFLVILDEQVDAEAVVADFVASAETDIPDRLQRAEALYRALAEHAQVTQAPLRAWLDARGIPYRAFYLVNMIEVRGDAELAQELRSLPGVNRLAGNPLVAGEQPVEASLAPAWLQALPAEGAQSADVWHPGLYGLPYTHAPEVWDLGYTGQGIVVASQDTGVQWDHPALIERYRGWDADAGLASHPYNWFDAWDDPDPADLCGPDHQIPCDDNSHGTHTVGTILGDATNDAGSALSQIGMAPGAQWIGCRNMRNDFGTPASYTACFEFMLAPYPQGGDPFTDGRPELAPHILNNSWRCTPSEGCDETGLRQVVETARAAGQLVVASTGNLGPGCYTVVEPPGLHDAAFSIGAHDDEGSVAWFSSRGPVTIDGSNRLKPDIAAPGVWVLSAVPSSGYGYKSGTSMSAPHAAGAAALLWSAAPDLIGQIDLTEQALIKSATAVDDDQCLPGPASSPNPTYGFGRLDALAAVTLARTPWIVTVNAANAGDAPQAGVPVSLVDDLTRFRYRAVTNANGVARLRPVLSGEYTVRVGSNDAAVVIPGVRLAPTDDPDAGVRYRRIDVTYSELNEIYLPLVGQ